MQPLPSQWQPVLVLLYYVFSFYQIQNREGEPLQFNEFISD